MRLTASRIELARKCLWPFRPDAGDRNRSTSDANAGRDEHAHIEHTLKTGDVDPKSPTHQRWIDEWFMAEFEPGGAAPAPCGMDWHCEVPVGIDPLTGATVTSPDGAPPRDYAWATINYVVGTVDAWALREDTLYIRDWKTGQQRDLEPPDSAAQLLFAGAALARHLGHRGRVNVGYVLASPDRLWVLAADVPRADLLVLAAELADMRRRIDGDPQPTPGWWCKSKFCGYHGRCPATAGALETVSPAPPPFEVVLDPEQFEGDEHVRWQLGVVEAAAKRLDEAKAALKERGSRGLPVELGDGRWYGAQEKSRENLELNPEGTALLGEMGLGAAVETKTSASWSSVTAAAREVVAARKAAGEQATIKGVVASARKALRAVDAVRLSEWVEVGVYKRAVGQEG